MFKIHISKYNYGTNGLKIFLCLIFDIYWTDFETVVISFRYSFIEQTDNFILLHTFCHLLKWFRIPSDGTHVFNLIENILPAVFAVEKVLRIPWTEFLRLQTHSIMPLGSFSSSSFVNPPFLLRFVLHFCVTRLIIC